MRPTLFALLLLACPHGAIAQDLAPVRVKPPVAGSELAANAGPAFDDAGHPFDIGIFLRGSLRLLKARNRFQYGATLEGATDFDGRRSLAAGGVSNFRLLQRNGYFYGGAMAGYIINWAGPAGLGGGRTPAQGYVFGLQAGYVHNLGSRFALNGELAARNSHTRQRASDDQFYNPGGEHSLYLPMTIGLRYRF